VSECDSCVLDTVTGQQINLAPLDVALPAVATTLGAVRSGSVTASNSAQVCYVAHQTVTTFVETEYGTNVNSH